MKTKIIKELEEDKVIVSEISFLSNGPKIKTFIWDPGDLGSVLSSA